MVQWLYGLKLAALRCDYGHPLLARQKIFRCSNIYTDAWLAFWETEWSLGFSEWSRGSDRHRYSVDTSGAPLKTRCPAKCLQINTWLERIVSSDIFVYIKISKHVDRAYLKHCVVQEGKQQANLLFCGSKNMHVRIDGYLELDILIAKHWQSLKETILM